MIVPWCRSTQRQVRSAVIYTYLKTVAQNDNGLLKGRNFCSPNMIPLRVRCLCFQQISICWSVPNVRRLMQINSDAATNVVTYEPKQYNQICIHIVAIRKDAMKSADLAVLYKLVSIINLLPLAKCIEQEKVAAYCVQCG